MKPRLADRRVIALAIVLSVVLVPVLAAESDKATDEDYTSSNVPLVHLTPFVVLDSSLGRRSARRGPSLAANRAARDCPPRSTRSALAADCLSSFRLLIGSCHESLALNPVG